ncbi:unnamed protein product [Adineta steineri]|uniref:Uncharacterized protein n=1 Tax=Adineta steineri TaxID=433720 RepID=A0A815RDI2_9BILA|nr:unnamed protein product [Adineta steineri]CAF1475672.1 unnamed protein product [Adineta steineri]CAF1637181.1 unnamed protein product [Adineta steineri]CAF1637192.1 unnamed protein product [Adineta steineri]
MSRSHIDLLRDPHFITNTIIEHNQLRNILSRLNTPVLIDYAQDLIKTIVITEFNKQTPTAAIIPIVDASSPIKKEILSTVLSEKELDIIHRYALDITQASLNLSKEPMGMGFNGDKALGTDQHVFAILGPHRGQYYGEIAVVFKRELMLHPSSHFSIPAATLFPNGHVYTCLPWVIDYGTQDSRIHQFYKSKLHCSVSGYEYAAATLLIAIIGKDNKTTSIDMNDVIRWWEKVDSHMVFESYLPSRIPLSYIDHVYMPEIVFNSLTCQAQHSARTIFRDKLTVTNNNGKLYETYLFEQFTKRFDPNTNELSTSKGTMINLFA